MAGFTGVESAVKAFGSRDGIQRAASTDELERLTRARSAQAVMDKRIADAIMSTQQANSRTELENQQRKRGGGILDDVDLAVLGELATEYLNGQKARGVTQQNTARGNALDIIGPINPHTGAGNPMSDDAINAFNANINVASDSPFVANELNPLAQSDADREYKEAQAKSSEASARASDARAKYSQSRTAGVNGVNTAYKSLSAPEIALNFGTGPEAQAELIRFQVWKAKKSEADPRYRNSDFALPQYRLEKYGAGEDPTAGSSAENPHIAVPGEAKPPSGTWVQLPDGRVIQAP